MPDNTAIAGLARAVLAAHPDLGTPRELVGKLVELHPWVAEANRNSTYITCKRTMTGVRADGKGTPTAAHPAVEIDVEEGCAPWTVEDGHYRWDTKRGAFSRRVEDIDELFNAYSRHGLDKSQTQMLNDYGLQAWEWFSIKSKLLLTKLSNVFSPWTVSITPPAELEAMMQAKIARRYEKQGPLIERAVRDAAVSEMNKQLAGLSKRDAYLERISLALSDMLPELRYRRIASAPACPDGPQWLVVTIADPHVGAEVKKLLNAPRYDKAVLYQYADQLIERINERGAANVVLAGLGDALESFSGMSHENTFLGLNKDLAGASGIFGALEFYSYLVERIYNVREIWGVSGNHDRTSASNKLDTRGEAAHILYFMLKERFGKYIGVHYRHDVLVREIDGICYLLTHGHLGLAKGDKNLGEAIARHRIPGLYCAVFMAHLHSRITKMDTEDYCVRHSPSFFTGNEYSSDGGWSTLAGFLTSENRAGSGYPKVVDEPLFAQPFSFASVATQSIV